MQRIKQMALRGLAHLVSREDKQWVLDVSGREHKAIPFKAAVKAMAEGYDMSRVYVAELETVAV
jgi:hypothetical protein